MKILFNDIIQYSNAPNELKSPMLSDTTIESYFIIALDKPREINAIGIGNTNGTVFDILLDDNQFDINFSRNGLYCLDKKITASKITISTNGTFIGRFGAGLGINIPTAVAKEPAFLSTSEPRVTLSGQLIQGLGGYNYRSISLDSRYKINELAMKEIEEGYQFIGMGYPFFIELSAESYKLPFDKLYATEKNQNKLSFESGVRKYLYSRRWDFDERF
jgi:hypothetical protein